MPKEVHASHILVRTKEEADELVKKLQDGASFEDLAREYSVCPSGKKSGGSLGWFGRQKMVKEFEKVAFSLKAGDISQPFKTQFGWHIVKVNETHG